MFVVSVFSISPSELQMPVKPAGNLGRHTTGSSNLGRGVSSSDRKNAIQSLNTTPVATFNTTIPSSYICDKEAESVIVSVVKGLAEQEKVRQCNEKEDLVISKIEKEAQDCEEAYKAAIRAQPDFLNITIDPSLKVRPTQPIDFKFFGNISNHLILS